MDSSPKGLRGLSVIVHKYQFLVFLDRALHSHHSIFLVSKMDVTNFGEKPDELLKGTICNELAPHSQREAILDIISMSRTSR